MFDSTHLHSMNRAWLLRARVLGVGVGVGLVGCWLAGWLAGWLVG